MDDVQDHFIDTAQLVTMNLFILKNQSLTLGLIMNDIGNDSLIRGQVAEGVQKGVFDLGLHGWNHIDYTKLSELQQQDSLKEANDKMQRLYGNTSDIFIPPYGTFNNGTINAMSRLGIRILSAATFSDKSNSIYNANNVNAGLALGKTPATIGANSTNETKRQQSTFLGNTSFSAKANANSSAATVYHVPGMIFFKDREVSTGKPVKTPIRQILSDVQSNIKQYGYAVIVFHPQDFVKTDQNGKFTNNLDQKQVNDLSNLIDYLLSKKVPITTMSKLVGITPRKFTPNPN